MVFKRKSKTVMHEQEMEPITVAIFDPNASDTAETALNIAKEWKKKTGKKAIIVEFPCWGLPRLSSKIEGSDGIEKERSIEQFLLDSERNDLKSFEDYMYQTEDFDCIMVHPKTNPDIPVHVKLSHQKTILDAPISIKRGLSSYYDLIIFSLQGQMFNPMTFFSLKYSDGILLNLSDTTSLPWGYTTFKKLKNYGISLERVCLHSQLKIDLPEKVFRKDELLQFVMSLKPNINSAETKETIGKKYTHHIGIINPVEHVSYQNSGSVNQAELNQKDAEMYKNLLDNTRRFLRQHHNNEFVMAIFDEQERSKVKYYIADYIREQTQFKFKIDMDRIIKMVQVELTEMGVLQPVLDDPHTSSIEINGPEEVISEIDGVPTHDHRVKFQDNNHIYATVSKMLAPMGKTLSANEPVIDSNYRGFRLNITLERNKGGISSNHPIISIRKFPPDVYSDEDCIKYGNLNEEIVDFFQDIYPIGVNVVIGGSVNSGKTSQLIRIPLYLDPLTRILTIEDSEEMMLKQKEAYKSYPNIGAFIVKEHENNRRRYNIAKIVKVTLRQNPDWIMIGEVRDGEAASEALEAANTGNNIALSIHANDGKMTAVRFMQLSGNDEIAASQVAATMDLILFQQSVNGVRVLTEVSELISFNGTEPVLNPIFQYDFKNKVHVRVGGLKKLKIKLQKKGIPAHIYDRWCAEEEGM
ncbi:CpaF family protein [Paenibacillus anaericanus]|uniref:CpaF family protein n=1 Tax=Paenibacillus anaericanus TaxID=170367 RepID=A0A433XVH4_9BACL|nr:ATPase, T2SS/T4P/T4SS family [Paenibacillus anaericanus]RUT38682.1 CpaF family protein [Paenibacillus anaericanus]